MKKSEKETDPTLDHFREKRKWQIALRRYLLERQKVPFYAPYFGLDIIGFREWIGLQFDQETRWEGFGSTWQFDHIVPVAYFDFKLESDLKLCWNFTNIRVEKSQSNRNSGNKIDVLTAKAYFEDLFNSTGYSLCNEMIRKIELIEKAQMKSNKSLENFITTKRSYLETLAGYGRYEFEQLNSEVSLEDIEKERKMLSKFGK